MSLLLEALKKAERAKEEAQRRADAGSEAERTQLRLEGDAAADGAAERKPLMTRDKLPDISAPLEIVSNDLAPAPSAPAPQPVAPAERPRPEARPADTQPAERATARKVFEAKFREPNPRMPFYIAMGCLGAFAVGTVIYFYLQLRSPPPLVNTNPPSSQSSTGTRVSTLKLGCRQAAVLMRGSPSLRPTVSSNFHPIASHSARFFLS